MRLAVLFLVLLLSASVFATVESINYPAPNEYISQTSRLRLNVTSSANSSDCFFNYNNVRNVSVNCNGTTIVNLPSADGTYQLNVGDGQGSGVTQYVFVEKPSGLIVLFIYTLSIGLMLILLYLLFVIVVKTSLLSYGVTDLFAAWGVAFGFLITYQLVLEYLSVGFLIDWMNLFYNYGGVWVLTVLSLTCWTFCAIARAMTKKKPGDPKVGWLD